MGAGRSLSSSLILRPDIPIDREGIGALLFGDLEVEPTGLIDPLLTAELALLKDRPEANSLTADDLLGALGLELIDPDLALIWDLIEPRIDRSTDCT